MMAAHHLPPLIDRLPALRGRVRAGAPLGPSSWFRVGGAAEVLVRPDDTADLAQLLAQLPETEKIAVLGAASNLIIRDGGIRGIVIRLGGGFAATDIQPDGIVAGAACLDATVAQAAAAAGLAGLEFLSGIPGSIGGAVAMNAGAYGSDLASILDWAEIVLPGGDIVRLSGRDLGFSYRHAALPPGGIVVRARLRAAQSDPILIAARMAEIKKNRTATQPVRARTGGSTFRNPAASSFKAWELIDQAGCRGLIRNGAMVSDLHCNFLLNTGDATAADLEGLGEEVRRRVHAMSGISLEWEIRRLGTPGSRLVRA